MFIKSFTLLVVGSNHTRHPPPPVPSHRQTGVEAHAVGASGDHLSPRDDADHAPALGGSSAASRHSAGPPRAPPADGREESHCPRDAGSLQPPDPGSAPAAQQASPRLSGAPCALPGQGGPPRKQVFNTPFPGADKQPRTTEGSRKRPQTLHEENLALQLTGAAIFANPHTLSGTILPARQCRHDRLVRRPRFVNISQSD